MQNTNDRHTQFMLFSLRQYICKENCPLNYVIHSNVHHYEVPSHGDYVLRCTFCKKCFQDTNKSWKCTIVAAAENGKGKRRSCVRRVKSVLPISRLLPFHRKFYSQTELLPQLFTVNTRSAGIFGDCSIARIHCEVRNVIFRRQLSPEQQAKLARCKIVPNKTDNYRLFQRNIY